MVWSIKNIFCHLACMEYLLYSGRPGADWINPFQVSQVVFTFHHTTLLQNAPPPQSIEIFNICSVCLQKNMCYNLSKNKISICSHVVRKLDFNPRIQLSVILFLSQSLIINYWLTALMAHIRMCICLYSPFLGKQQTRVPGQLSINGAYWETARALKPQGAKGTRVPLL